MKVTDKNTLKQLVTEAVKDALSECSCANCPVPVEVMKEIGHLGDAIKSIGEGDISHGIERIREDHRFLLYYRKLAEKVGNIVLKAIVIAAFVATMTYFGWGHLVGKK